MQLQDVVQIVLAGPVTKTRKRPGPDQTVTDCNQTGGYSLSYSKIERPVKDRLLGPVITNIIIYISIPKN